MQWAQLQLRSACYVVISVMSQRTACFSCAPKSLAGRAQFDGSAGGAGGGALCVFARLRVPV